MKLYILFERGKPARIYDEHVLAYTDRRKADDEAMAAREHGCRYTVRAYDCEPVAEGRGEG